MAKYNKSQLYFFKFPNTFFDSDEIEDILKDDDGPSIVILYLKLILLATNKMGYLGRIIAGELKPIKVEDQLLLGGKFFCSKNKLKIICEQRYDQDTWLTDNKHGLVMIFERYPK